MKKILKRFVYSLPAVICIHIPSLLIGTLVYKLTRRTPWISFWSMRKLYAKYGHSFLNKFNDFLVSNSAKQNKCTFGQKSLFSYSKEDVSTAVEHLKENGYSILQQRLPEDVISKLTKIATESICTVTDGTHSKKAHFSIDATDGTRFDLNESDLLRHEIVIQLANDPLFLKIAQGYLGSTPVNDMITMWWNKPGKNVDLSKIAQLYHFDMDRTRWLKFFFYLTDVSMSTGPHSFIKKSHVDKKYSHDGRLTDEDVYAAYGKANEIIFTGPRGLILAEDTLGLHKGFKLESGYRLLFQLEYATNLFGQNYLRISQDDIHPDLKMYSKIYPDIWQRADV